MDFFDLLKGIGMLILIIGAGLIRFLYHPDHPTELFQILKWIFLFITFPLRFFWKLIDREGNYLNEDENVYVIILYSIIYIVLILAYILSEK